MKMKELILLKKLIINFNGNLINKNDYDIDAKS